MSAQHTSAPRLSGPHRSPLDMFVVNNEDHNLEFARCEREEDAARIVRCVNAHDALVEQLAATADYLRTACLVITDPDSRAMALLQVRASRTLVDGLKTSGGAA